jgi:DNA-binding CsgD family transcriptional regulator
MRAIEELRDPLALALAAASAYSAYLFGGRDWQIAAIPIAVLAVRVIAGLLLPLPVLPTPRLTSDEYVIARLMARGFTNTQIGEQLRATPRAIDRLEARIVAKIGGTREDIVRYVGAPGAPEPPPRHWYERTIVRGTLAGAGLISLVWTLYNIGIRVFGR